MVSLKTSLLYLSTDSVGKVRCYRPCATSRSVTTSGPPTTIPQMDFHNRDTVSAGKHTACSDVAQTANQRWLPVLTTSVFSRLDFENYTSCKSAPRTLAIQLVATPSVPNTKRRTSTCHVCNCAAVETVAEHCSR